LNWEVNVSSRMSQWFVDINEPFMQNTNDFNGFSVVFVC